MCNVPLIDVRPASDYLRAHPPGAVSFPLEELPARVHELPRKQQRLRVTDSDGIRARSASEFLTARGHPVKIESLRENDLTESGPSVVRLWQPNPFLVESLDIIARERSLAGLSALDVACGTGRDAAYLALRGLAVMAIDLLPDALARANDLAHRSGVVISTFSHDLERKNSLPQLSPVDVLVVFRYLHRPLFPALAAAVAPGGYVVYETFHERNRETGLRPQNPHHLLKTAELPAHFPDFDVLIARDAFERDGRFYSSMLARRAANVR